jgi:hypothetical protein
MTALYDPNNEKRPKLRDPQRAAEREKKNRGKKKQTRERKHFRARGT